jgi:hypothetical protein
MTYAKQHLLNQFEHPRQHGMPALIIAMVVLLNIVATASTLVAIDPLF